MGALFIALLDHQPVTPAGRDLVAHLTRPQRHLLEEVERDRRQLRRGAERHEGGRAAVRHVGHHGHLLPDTQRIGVERHHHWQRPVLRGRRRLQHLRLRQDHRHRDAEVDPHAAVARVVQPHHLPRRGIDDRRAGVAPQRVAGMAQPVVVHRRIGGAAALAADVLRLAHRVADDPVGHPRPQRRRRQRQGREAARRIARHFKHRVVEVFRGLDRLRVDGKALRLLHPARLVEARQPVHREDLGCVHPLVLQHPRHAVVVGQQVLLRHEEGGAGKGPPVGRDRQHPHAAPHLPEIRLVVVGRDRLVVVALDGHLVLDPQPVLLRRLRRGRPRGKHGRHD